MSFEQQLENINLRKSNNFYEMMRTRRTIRHFSSLEIQDEILFNAIKTAGTSPSGANRQPWHFALIKSQDIKDQIRMAAEEVEKIFYNNKNAKQWIEDLKPLGTHMYKPYLSQAPALIAVFSRTEVLASDHSMQKTYYPIESTGIAVGFLLASLHQSGLATLTHTPRPMYFLNKVLNLDKTFKPFMIVVVGYPALPLILPALTRKDISEICKIY